MKNLYESILDDEDDLISSTDIIKQLLDECPQKPIKFMGGMKYHSLHWRTYSWKSEFFTFINPKVQEIQIVYSNTQIESRILILFGSNIRGPKKIYIALPIKEKYTLKEKQNFALQILNIIKTNILSLKILYEEYAMKPNRVNIDGYLFYDIDEFKKTYENL